MNSRPIILGGVGDSAAGKTTLTRGLVRTLGQENLAHTRGNAARAESDLRRISTPGGAGA